MNLALVPLEDIFNELDKRFDTVLVMASRERNGGDITEFHKYGSDLMCLGLCVKYMHRLRHSGEIENIESFDQD